MLNKTEYNGVVICVLPIGVEAPSNGSFPKSSRKKAPKSKVSKKEEVVEFEDLDDEWYEKEYPKDVFVEETIKCENGTMTIKCSKYQLNEIHTWLYKLGAFVGYSDDTFAIELDESGIFHIFGDNNDSNYRYFRGDFMHKTPEKCFGLVEVEPLEDGGQVWRDFSDFDEVDVTFNLY